MIFKILINNYIIRIKNKKTKMDSFNKIEILNNRIKIKIFKLIFKNIS
jgi:hypothetical protein